MAEYDQNIPVKADEGSTVEATDRGLFGFGGKKEEEKHPQEEAISTEFEQKVQFSEPEHKHGLLEKLHRSSSSSSSSDEEEVEEGGEKKKKKKGLKEKIKGKISPAGDKKEEGKVVYDEDTSVPVEKCDEPAHAEVVIGPNEPDEKKGFLDKIKEKLPGGHKKAEEVGTSPQPTLATSDQTTEGEAKEKKGFLEKIKEKLPGYHPKAEEEKEKEKEKEKEAASQY